MYAAHTLPTSRPSIRLVAIHPSTDFNSPIICSLRVTCLEGSPQYEALSYCWGDANITADILVEDTTFSATTNLVAALRHLRRAGSKREMWIDAIGINQDDINEKTTQIPLMRDIYSKSACVVIWLGSPDPTSRDAFRFLRKAAEKYYEGLPDGFSRVQQENGSFLSLALGRNGAHFVLDAPVVPTRPSDLWKPPDSFHRATVDLLRRPWFRRVWIIQEVAFARRALVLSGWDALGWDAFVDAVRLVDMLKSPSYQYYDVSNVSPDYHVAILAETRAAIARGEYFTVRDAMRRFAPFESTLPRDKAFALRSLLRRPEAIEVDYNPMTPDERIFVETAMRAIQESGDLSLLLDRHDHSAGPGRPPGFPSWVPVWPVPGYYMGQSVAAVSAQQDFSASCGVDAEVSFSEDHRRLLISGQFVDRVVWVGRKRPSYMELGRKYWPKDSLFPTRDPYVFVADSCEAMRDWMSLGYLDGSDSTGLYATGETMREAFWQTFLRPNLTAIANETARRDFEAALRVRELSFLWLDWFVRNVDKRLHWTLLWTLLSLYLWFMGLYFLISLACGRLKWHAEYVTPVDPDQSAHVMGRTAGGLLGFIPAETQTDDGVVILKGATKPYILRRCGKDRKVVGSAYIHGIMYGGGFDMDKCDSITLV